MKTSEVRKWFAYQSGPPSRSGFRHKKKRGRASPPGPANDPEPGALIVVTIFVVHAYLATDFSTRE